MSDDIKFEVNEFGLLETVNVITEDRTAEILSQLANAPSTVLGISEAEDRSAAIIQKIKEFEQIFEVKASDIYGNSDGYSIQYDIAVPNEMGIDEIKIVKASFKLGNKKWLLTFGLLFVSGLLAEIVGLLMCGIGILFTVAFVYHPTYLIYKDVIGFDEEHVIDEIGNTVE